MAGATISRAGLRFPISADTPGYILVLVDVKQVVVWPPPGTPPAS